MSTITKELSKKQAQSDWFSSLKDEKQKGLLIKYGIDRTIELGTLLNEDVFFIYQKEHNDLENCELCDAQFDTKDMRQDKEGCWFCEKCVFEVQTKP